MVAAGAAYEPITGTASALTAYAAEPFVITFSNDTTALSYASFAAALHFGTGTYSFHVAITGLNNNGKPDVVATNFNAGNGSTIAVLKNTTSGITISFSPRLSYSTGSHLKRLAQ